MLALRVGWLSRLIFDIPILASTTSMEHGQGP